MSAARPDLGVSHWVGETEVAYDKPVIKSPVWTVEVPVYFFFGGLAGASAGLAYLAERSGNDVLARRAWAVSLAGISASPPLLIADLGRPERFFNMLRVFKVTSPMSVGSWVLAGAGAAVTAAAVDAWTGRLGAVGRVAAPVAAGLGLPLATYTAALVANTSVPVWHEARRELPFVFAGSSAASAGALAIALTPSSHAAPGRRLLVGGACVELAATAAMERRLGDLRGTYRTGRAGGFARAAKALSVAGAATAAVGARRSRPAAVAAAALMAGGALCMRFAIFFAGPQSAADPAATVRPQRQRIRAGDARGAARSGARHA